MPDTSPNLDLPWLLPAQAQKHVTHNEALQRLDLFVQLTVQRFDAETPPASPPEGRIWALGPAPTGDWAGQAGRLATFLGGAWDFLEPREGWRAWGLAEAQLRVWRGTGWAPLPLDDLPGLGIGTAHDGTNRLAVVSPATLFSHAGAGHQVKVNKAAAGETATLLFQDDWSGRAEMGLAGNDDFSVKVSADGSAWTEALRISRASGAAGMAAGLTIDGQVAFHRGNLLGAVGQSAGVPSGAVIERGSNANGEYVRFADGTQICTARLTINSTISGALLGGYRNTGQTWLYPAAFATAPQVTGSPGNIASLSVVTNNAGLNAVSVFHMSVAAQGTAAERVAIMVAIGRWF
jgi:hypothetical protein